MTTLFNSLAAPTDLGWVGGLVTALFLVLFVGWTVWAFWPGHRKLLDAAAHIPFDGGDE